MKMVVKKILFKGVLTLGGILVISSALQLLIYVNGPELVDHMIAMLSGPSGADDEARARMLYEKLGFDHFFIPDLWPFDNESLWHRMPLEEE